MEKKIVIERLKTEAAHIGTSETDIFSSDVPESKFRYVVKVILMGDGAADRVVDIYKKKEDGTYEKKIPMIHVASTEVLELGSDNPENPLLVLEGGTNLAGKVNAGTGISLAVIYWDDER